MVKNNSISFKESEEDSNSKNVYRSNVNPKFNITENEWLITVLNTQPNIFGHASIVVEGFEKNVDSQFFSPQPFIGRYHIVADIEKKFFNFFNDKGIIKEVRCEEDINDTNYTDKKHQMVSYQVSPAAAKRMINNIKDDEALTLKAAKNEKRKQKGKPLLCNVKGNPYEYLPYQLLGKHHPLTKIFGSMENGDNCAGWCNAKLAVAGIRSEEILPKPKISASNKPNCIIS